MNIVVLISGRGSNLEAMLLHQEGYQVKHVISNNLKAKGLEVAQKHGVTNTYIKWSNLQLAEKKLSAIIQQCNADLIVLAGFMRILSPSFVHQFKNKIINIHPSLLPKYPGLDTHKKVLLNQDEYHGATVHIVDEQLDHGRILAQIRFKISRSDDAESLAKKLIHREHKLLTTTIGLIVSGNIELNSDVHMKINQPEYKPFLIQ